MTAEATWRALQLCWIDVYIGPPDVIAHDAGKNFIAEKFQIYADMMHISTKQIPIESANSMSFAERYHQPPRRAYSIMKQEGPSLDRETLLQGAVKSINDTAGPDGIVPTLLVYGALPRLGLPIDKPAHMMYERAKAVHKATAAMSRYFAKRQVTDALRTRNGPDMHTIHTTPIGTHVLVYRTHKDKWEGPYTLLDRTGETCTLLLPDGPKQFRTTVVKPFHTDESSTHDTTASTDGSNNGNTTMPTMGTVAYLHCSANFDWVEGVTDDHGGTITSMVGDIVSPRFQKSRLAELDGLSKRGAIQIVPASDAAGHRIFGSRFVDTVKNEGTPNAYEKSRLVVQAVNDNKRGLLTYSPTVQRSS